jgi:hypothetical protein
MAKFTLKQASDWQREEPIEINSLEELLAFVEKHGDVIIYSKREHEEHQTLTIYDTYVE